MSSSREDQGAWPRDPEASSASGGHVPPGSSDGPLFDPLTAPLPSERAPQERTYGADARQTQGLAPRDTILSPKAPEEEGPTTRRRRRVASRRVRRTIKKVDPLSVLKIALIFYLIMFVVWLVVVAFAFNVLDATGLFSTIEDAVGPEGFALEGENFEITLGVIEKWAFLFGLISLLVASVSTLLGSILYNVAADLFGGVELTFVEREL